MTEKAKNTSTKAKPKSKAKDKPKPKDTTPPPVNAEAPQSVSALWSAAKPASSLTQFSKLKILLAGASGGGKSTTGAKFERPLYVPTEMQAIPIIQHTNPNAIIFHNSDGRPGIRDSRDLQQFRAMIHDPDLSNKVDAVVLDSITDCQRIIKDAYVRAQGTGNKSPDQNTWGNIIDLTARLAREVRDLDVHALVTVLDKEIENNGLIIHRPSVQGKTLPNDLAQYFNLVGFAFAEEMDGGEIRNSTMFRASSDRYMVKKLPQLDDIEAPEPLLWASKVFGDTQPDAVKERVEAWAILDGEPEPDDVDLDTETDEPDEKEEASEKKPDRDDPFADQ